MIRNEWVVLVHNNLGNLYAQFILTSRAIRRQHINSRFRARVRISVSLQRPPHLLVTKTKSVFQTRPSLLLIINHVPSDTAYTNNHCPEPIAYHLCLSTEYTGHYLVTSRIPSTFDFEIVSYTLLALFFASHSILRCSNSLLFLYL